LTVEQLEQVESARARRSKERYTPLRLRRLHQQSPSWKLITIPSKATRPIL
jgi:hypothetical protein